MMKIIRPTSKKLDKIYNRGLIRSRRIEDKVRRILEDVRLLGDEAVIKYTKKFDRVKLTPKQLKVAEIEISGAYQNISPNFVSTLKVVIENVNRFYRKTLVKQGASIGANATIVCGHTIGRFAFIGAGSVVTKDLPDYALAYGNPAEIKGWMCECGQKIKFYKEKAKCAECKISYTKKGILVERILKERC